MNLRMKYLRLSVLTAVFAALICVATMLIPIPTFVTNGYVNLGDGVILLGSWILGPWFGFLAGGIGSALADLLLGYTAYAPATFVIKGLIALISSLVFSGITLKTEKPNLLHRLPGAVLAEAEMVLGYFLYESTLLGYGLGAAGSVISNICQGIAGIIISLVLAEILIGAKVLNKKGKIRKFE